MVDYNAFLPCPSQKSFAPPPAPSLNTVDPALGCKLLYNSDVIRQQNVF